MGRSAKNRKQVHDGQVVDPRKTRAHDWEKDEEEVDLEAKLFGASRVKTTKMGKRGRTKVEEDEQVDGEFGELDDDDLFEVDAPVMDMPSEDEEEGDDHEEIDFEVDLEGEDEEEGGESDESDDGEEIDRGEESEASEASEESDAESTASSSSSASGASIAFADEAAAAAGHSGEQKKRKRKGVDEDAEPELEFPSDMEDELPSGAKAKGKGKAAGVWSDPSDDLVRVDLEANRLLKKLGRGKGDPNVNGAELEKRLREQFETLHPRPAWAANRITAGTPSLRLLLSSTKSFIAPESHQPLPSGNLELQRVLNANHQNPTVGRRAAQGAGKGVIDVAWHPNPKVGVMAVAGGDRRVRFFNIDGHTNPTLLTIHLPALPLTKTTFHPSGSSLLLAGSRPYYYTYDLPSARCIRSPRNLFGSVITPSTPNSLTRHAFSPDGSMLAVAGRRGAVSILDWSGVGVGAVIAELKSGRGGAVVAMTWSRDSKELSVLGGRDAAEVEVWDVAERQVVRKWRDDRAFGGTTMQVSEDGQYTAIGSSTGIVNLYSSSSLSTPVSDSSQHILPTPYKSLEHLTTPIASTAFHPTSEMLITASNTRKNQLRTYHLPSGSAFANWPTKTTPLGRVTNVSFSSGGEYLATGNERGLVLLYSIKHYSRA